MVCDGTCVACDDYDCPTPDSTEQYYVCESSGKCILYTEEGLTTVVIIFIITGGVVFLLVVGGLLIYFCIIKKKKNVEKEAYS